MDFFKSNSHFQVIHSGIPITLVPLDATNTIPITDKFFETFERNQQTYEAQYAFKSLKMVHDTWHDNQFFKVYNTLKVLVVYECRRVGNEFNPDFSEFLSVGFIYGNGCYIINA